MTLLPALPEGSTASLLTLFLQGKSASTIRSYRSDLIDFSSFVGGSNPPLALQSLIQNGPGPANELALRYLHHLRERGLKAATINRRIASLRSVVALARTIGLINWALEVRGVKGQPYRDTRGPGLDGVRRLLRRLERETSPIAVRNLAIVHLLFDLALRSHEVLSLNVEHVDRRGSVLHVLRKGRTERELVSLPRPTLDAIEQWIDIRGTEPGALFTNFDRARKGKALTASGLYRVVRRLGRDIGRRLRPHGFRHAAITSALHLTGGDVRSVARFSSHRSIQTVLIYDDARQDAAGEVAKLVAEAAS